MRIEKIVISSTLENLADRLNTLNQSIDDMMLITKIIATLHTLYGIPHLHKEKTLINLISKLQLEENRLKSNDNLEKQV